MSIFAQFACAFKVCVCLHVFVLAQCATKHSLTNFVTLNIAVLCFHLSWFQIRFSNFWQILISSCCDLGEFCTVEIMTVLELLPAAGLEHFTDWKEYMMSIIKYVIILATKKFLQIVFKNCNLDVKSMCPAAHKVYRSTWSKYVECSMKIKTNIL